LHPANITLRKREEQNGLIFLEAPSWLIFTAQMEMGLATAFEGSQHLQMHWEKKQLLNWRFVSLLCDCLTTSCLDMPAESVF